MKIQTFFTRVKKVLNYPFNWDFIDRFQRAMLYLEDLKITYYEKLNEKYDEGIAIAYQEATKLQNKLSQCWDRHDILLLLSKEINAILWGNNKINIQIFDLRTNWFLWEKIFLHVDLIQEPNTNTIAKRQLNTLRKISDIFDLGK